MAATRIVPVPLKQLIGLETDELATKSDGSGTFILVVLTHPLASVTVKLLVPARTVNVPVPEYGEVPPTPETVT